MYLHDFEKNKVLFLMCDCKSEVLTVEYDPEIKMADLAIYENQASYLNKMSIIQRLRYAWRVLVMGKPFGDQISIRKDQLKDIKEFLSHIV